MQKNNIRKIAVCGAVAAVYVVITVFLGDLAYANIQFRISEALVMLCFYRKEYCYAMTVGCLISNLFSMMPADILFGTLATLLSAVCVYKCRNIYLASLFPTIFNAVIVGIELKCFLGLPLVLSMLQVAAGEFVCVSIIGVSLFKILEKNKGFMKLITFEAQ